jgi:hypothetical protein
VGGLRIRGSRPWGASCRKAAASAHIDPRPEGGAHLPLWGSGVFCWGCEVGRIAKRRV